MENARQIARTVFAILCGLSEAVLTRNYFPEESCFPKTRFTVRMWSEMNGKTPTALNYNVLPNYSPSPLYLPERITRITLRRISQAFCMDHPLITGLVVWA